MFTVEQKIDELIKLLGVRIVECDHPDCLSGIDKTSYSDQHPCEKCVGAGELMKEKVGPNVCLICDKDILSDDQWELLQESLAFQKAMRENACVCDG